ncbi:hypothetical protein C8R47DRAFT_1314414 [Mycena vitilis]|nr:hypothetical protein C8R47DRAFT_1314414 [Mycena vitilis]
MAHSGLITRIDSAIKTSLPSVQSRFDFHLTVSNGGLARRLRSPSDVSIQDFRAVGEFVLNQCILRHFLRSGTPYKYRGTVTARILLPDIMQLLLGKSKLDSEDLDADPADTVFIFVGCSNIPSISSRQLAHHSRAADRLIAMAASLGTSTEIAIILKSCKCSRSSTAALVEGLNIGSFQSVTFAFLPATLGDDYAEEQEVLTLLDPPGLGQDFEAVSSSAVSGILVSLAGAAHAAQIRTKVLAFIAPEVEPFKQAALMAAKTLFRDFRGLSTRASLPISSPAPTKRYPQAQRLYLPDLAVLHLRLRLSFLDIKSTSALVLPYPNSSSIPLHAPQKPQTPHTQDHSPILSVLILYSHPVRRI